MLLIIHNLPTKIRYSEVKTLIRDRCNLKDLIVDNLVYESPQSRKVTVGLSDENDAISVINELDGLLFMGQRLQVEDLRKNTGPPKSNPNQGYNRGNMSQGGKGDQAPIPPRTPAETYSAPFYMAGQNQNPGSSQGSNSNQGQGQPPRPVQPASSLPPYMQRSFSSPYFMYGQSPFAFPMGLPNAPYTVPSPYSSPGVPMNQDASLVYGKPPKYGDIDLLNSSSAQPDFIPCANDKPHNEYAKKDTGSRYFEEKNDQRYRDRSERPSTSRGDRESYEPRSRSDERRHDDWNPERFRRSENRNSDNNPKHSRDSYDQSYDGNYEQEPNTSGLKRSFDDRRNAGRSENFDDDPGRHYDNNQDDNYNRSNQRAPGNTYDNSRYKWTKSKNGNSNFGGYNDSKPGPSNEGNVNRNQINPHNRFSNFDDPTFSELNEPAIYLTNAEFKKIKKARDRKRSTFENRDNTMRSQAVSKIVRTSVEESGLRTVTKKAGFVPFMKSIVRTRINKMLGHRMTVPAENIVEEYYKTFPNHVHKTFVLESKAKFNKITDFPSRATPIRTPLIQQAAANQRNQPGPSNRPTATNQPIAQKRNAADQPPSAPKPKKPPVDIPRPPPYRPPTPGRLPKYPNADKKAYKQLKTLAKEEHQKEIYTLEPDLKEALDNEVKVLEGLFRQGCRNHGGGEDGKICQRIEKTTDEIMKVIKLDLTKRLLNVTCNLPLRMFGNGSFRVKDVGPLLKPYGIISCRKTDKRKKLFIVVCEDYPSYDYLCTKGDIDVGKGLILTFKPLHLAGPRKRPKNTGKVHQTSDEEEEFGEEGGDAVDDDEEMGDEMAGGDGADIEEKDVPKNEEKISGDVKREIDIKVVNQNKDFTELNPKAEPIQKPSVIDTKNQSKNSETKIQSANSETKNQSENSETNNQSENSETKNLVKDIQELAKSIENDPIIENPEGLDVSDIGQDDLEDY